MRTLPLRFVCLLSFAAFAASCARRVEVGGEPHDAGPASDAPIPNFGEDTLVGDPDGGHSSRFAHVSSTIAIEGGFRPRKLRYAGSQVAVSFDGEQYLVVWIEEAGAIANDLWSLRAARIRPDGEVLDPGGVALASGHFVKPSEFEVAAGDGLFVVSWLQRARDPEDTTQARYGRVRASDGAVLDPGGVVVSDGPGGDLAVAYAGGVFVIAHLEGVSSSPPVPGAVMDNLHMNVLQPQSGELGRQTEQVVHRRYGYLDLAMAASNDALLVTLTVSGHNIPDSIEAWRYNLVGTAPEHRPEDRLLWPAHQVVEEVVDMGMRLGGARPVFDGSRFWILRSKSPYPLEDDDYATVAALPVVDWEQLMVGPAQPLFEDLRLPRGGLGQVNTLGNRLRALEVVAADGGITICQPRMVTRLRVDATGEQFEMLDRHALDSPAGAPGVACAADPSRALVVYYANPDEGGVAQLWIDENGQRTDAAEPLWGPVQPRAASVATNDRTGLIVWKEERGQDRPQAAMLSMRIDLATGEAIDSEPTVFAGNHGEITTEPKVASNGEGFVAVWSQGPGFQNNSQAMMQRFDSAGRPVGDAERIGRSAEAWTPVIASNGAGYLVAYIHRPWGSRGTEDELRVLAFDGAMDPIGNVLHLPASNGLLGVTLASNNDSYVMVWEQYPTVGDRNLTLNISQIRLNGTELVATAARAMVNDSSSGLRPQVAFSGDAYLVAWEDYSSEVTEGANIVAAILDAESLAVRQGPTVLAGTERSEQLASIAGDGAGFMFSWVESGQRFVRRIEPAGGELALIGDVVTFSQPGIDEPLAEGYVHRPAQDQAATMAAYGRGEALVAYTRLDLTRARLRVEARHVVHPPVRGPR